MKQFVLASVKHGLEITLEFHESEKLGHEISSSVRIIYIPLIMQIGCFSFLAVRCLMTQQYIDQFDRFIVTSSPTVKCIQLFI